MVLNPGFILAIALALIHGFASKLPIFSIIPRFRWLSFAGGVSLGYVFLEVFPKLNSIQAKLEHSDIPFLHYLETNVYLFALIGLIVFYGIGLFTSKSKNQDNSSQFWISILTFSLLNVITGYLLQDVGHHSLVECLLFFIPIALHFFIIDEHLREHHQSLFDKRGRWYLVGAIIFGSILGQLGQLNEAAIAIVWSFLAGSIILNVLKHELPDEKESCFGSFVMGNILFAILLGGSSAH